MHYSLNEKEVKEFQRILNSLDKTIEEASFWNEVLNKKIHKKEWISKATPLDPLPYSKDPYFQNVHPSEKIAGSLKLHYKKYQKEQGFVYDEIEVNPSTYEEKTPFGYFEKPFSYLALSKNEETWMSIIPHEINTMKDSIKEANGNVLVLGLGLGYYPYSILSKKNVSKVTIIEYDQEIISLFQKELLPFFRNKEKIVIVQEDAFKYLSREQNYDYCFADLWHMPQDGLSMYLKLRKLEQIQKKTTFSYWIENSMLALIRRALIILVFEELLEGKKDEDYLFAETFDDRLINSLHFLLKDVSIKNIADLRRYLNIEGLRDVAKSLSLEA